MKYFESSKSRQLYRFNFERFLMYSYPRGINNKSKFNAFLTVLYAMKNWLRRVICWRRYDKVSSDVREYELKEYYKYDGKIPKIVIYTCITGGYDTLKEPFICNDMCDFIVITDEEVSSDSVWKKIPIEDLEGIMPAGLRGAQINRWVKMHPHKIFPTYEYSIYLDGLVYIVTDLLPIILEQKKYNKIIGMHLHYSREKISTEVRAMKKNNVIKDINATKKQIMRYYAEGFDDSIRLLEATIIVRKHNDILCRNIMEMWWHEYINGVSRDQISLPYVLWKHGLTMQDIYILGGNEYVNPRFYIVSHKNDCVNEFFE